MARSLLQNFLFAKYSLLIDFLFPTYCGSCRNLLQFPEKTICKECIARIQKATPSQSTLKTENGIVLRYCFSQNAITKALQKTTPIDLDLIAALMIQSILFTEDSIGKIIPIGSKEWKRAFAKYNEYFSHGKQIALLLQDDLSLTQNIKYPIETVWVFVL